MPAADKNIMASQVLAGHSGMSANIVVPFHSVA